MQWSILDTEQIKVVGRSLEEGDVVAATDLLHAYTHSLPAGFHDTSIRNACFTLVEKAISYNGIVLGSFTGAGGLDGVIVCYPVPEGLAVEGPHGISIDNNAALLAKAKEIAAESGRALGRLVEIPAHTEFTAL